MIGDLFWFLGIGNPLPGTMMSYTDFGRKAFGQSFLIYFPHLFPEGKLDQFQGSFVVVAVAVLMAGLASAG